MRATNSGRLACFIPTSSAEHAWSYALVPRPSRLPSSASLSHGIRWFCAACVRSCVAERGRAQPLEQWPSRRCRWLDASSPALRCASRLLRRRRSSRCGAGAACLSSTRARWRRRRAGTCAVWTGAPLTPPRAGLLAARGAHARADAAQEGAPARRALRACWGADSCASGATTQLLNSLLYRAKQRGFLELDLMVVRTPLAPGCGAPAPDAGANT